MSKIQRTAMGKSVDMDSLRLNNEETIAIGNMKVNARGDELGPGGRIARPRNQVMDEYYRLNTPTVVNNVNTNKGGLVEDEIDVVSPVIKTVEEADNSQNQLRGSLANSIAKK